MKQKLFLVATFMLALLFLGSCKPSGNDDPKVPEEKEYESEIDFTGWDIAAAGIEDEVLIALLDEVCPGYGTTGTEETELFLLGAYASAYDSQIEAVLDGGGACVLTEDLSVETISAFLKACGWDGEYAKEIDDIEHLAVFGVSGYDDVYLSYHEVLNGEDEGVVTVKVIQADTDSVGNDIQDESEYKESEESLFSTWEYAYLYAAYSWLAQSAENRKSYEEYDPYEIDEDYFAAPARVATADIDSATKKRSNEIEKIAQGVTYTANHNVTIKKVKTPSHACYSQDYVDINIGVVATYTIHQIFVFPGSGAGANSGDYYVVNSHLQWVNCGAFKGVGIIEHNVTNLRYCGFMPKVCSMISTPVVKNGYSVRIPANGSVLPETVNRNTMHKETRSFNLGLNATIGAKGSGDKETKGKKSSTKGSKGIEGNAGLTLGWGWNHTKEYTTYEWNVNKVGGTAASAGHQLTMNDDCLPEPRMKDPGFEGKDKTKTIRRDLYASTFDVHESWIWQIPETQTDNEDAPLKIKFTAIPSYTWMDHFITPSTRSTGEYDFGPYEKTVSINPTNRVSAGVIKMVNNLEVDGKPVTVSNVTFLNADNIKDTLFVDNNNTYSPNREMTFGMLSKYNYEIHFMAGRKRSEARWYKLVDNKSVGPNETIVIDNLDYDTEEVK